MDNAAQAEWVKAAMDRYTGPLTRYALLFTGNLQRAQDVVQDTFIRLCSEDRSRLEPHLAQWLFTVCRNRALDVQRKENRMLPLTETEMHAEASPEPSPAAQAEQREAATEILDLLSRLPQNQQEVVRLKFQNGLSYQEISRITNLTVTNVGFLIHTAIKTLRKQVQSNSTAALTRRKS